MSDPEVPAVPEDQLMREAAGWFARMRGPDSEESREEFEAWLRRGALHRGAYNRAAEIFAMGKLLAEEPDSTPRPGRRKRPVALAIVSAALIAVALMFLFTTRLISFGGETERLAGADSRRVRPAVMLTAPAGEDRAFNLADGSTVTLVGGSALEVSLGAKERRLELKRGRARFDVFHEERPFVVHAGGGRITAQGTLFEVALGRNRRVTVRLLEGAVDVSIPSARAAGKPERAVQRLRAGMALAFDAAPEAHAPIANAAAGRTHAPSPGEHPPAVALDFEAVSVAALVAQTNRISPRPIRLGNEAIGGRKVSGRFRIDDSGVLADRLGALLGLRVDRSDPGEIVLRAP